MSLTNNIYLIGAMGAGKSAVGKQLALLCGAVFVDSDQEIEQQAGVSIAWIFEKEKEIGFRQRESRIIAELTKKKNIVMSTGGGSIVAENNQRLLKATGLIVYLKVSLEVQFNRVQRRLNVRPLLKNGCTLTTLQAINNRREPLYTSLADVIVNTDHHSPVDIANHIVNELSAKASR